MKATKLIILLILVVFICASCGGGGGGKKNPGGSGGSGAIAKLNLKNASSLAIVPTSAVSKSSTIIKSSSASGNLRSYDVGNANTLVKITDTGAIMVVESYDEAGNVIQSESFNPTNIYDITNSEYLIVVFNSCEGYLVHKTTGSVYSLSNVGYPSYNNYFKNESKVFTDKYGNIYFRTNEGRVKKINIQDPKRLTADTISLSIDFVDSFTIDDEGNLFYTKSIEAIIKSTKNSSKMIDNVWSYWKALDGNFYFVNGDHALQKVTISDSGIDYTNVGYSFTYMPQPLISYLLTTSGRTILVTDSGKCTEVYPNQETIEFSGITLSKVESVVSSNNNYYIACLVNNNPGLLKVDSTNDNPQFLCEGYRIYKMVVSADNTVTFNAFKMSNSKKVIGKVNPSGQVSIIDETMDTEVVELIKVN